MKLTSLLQFVDKLQEAGKLYNCGLPNEPFMNYLIQLAGDLNSVLTLFPEEVLTHKRLLMRLVLKII